MAMVPVAHGAAIAKAFGLDAATRRIAATGEFIIEPEPLRQDPPVAPKR